MSAVSDISHYCALWQMDQKLNYFWMLYSFYSGVFVTEAEDLKFSV
jgi:hypothetical protein